MKKKIIAILLTVLLVAGLLSQIKIGELSDFVRGFSFGGLLWAFFVYALSYFFRAVRWQQLIHSKAIGMGELVLVTSAHIMFNNLLPSRSGEFSYIYLLKKRQGVSGSEGLATLVAARLYDFAVLAAFFLVSGFFFFGTFTTMTLEEIALGSAVIFAASVALIFNMDHLLRGILYLLKKMGTWLGWRNKKWMQYVLQKGGDVVGNFTQISSKKKFFPVVFTSFLGWGLKFFSYFLMLRAMLGVSEGIHPSFWMIILGTTAAELTTILPVHGIGGFGTYESAWAGAFYLLGFTKELAIKSAFSFHLLALLYSVILGVASLFLLRLKKTKSVEFKSDDHRIKNRAASDEQLATK